MQLIIDLSNAQQSAETVMCPIDVSETFLYKQSNDLICRILNVAAA